MANLIPIGQATVGSATVTLLSLLTTAEQTLVQNQMVHKLYLQAAVGNTNQIDVKYATKIICTLYKPPTTGGLPEHFLTIDENVGNSLNIANITLTGTNSGDKVNGYITIT